MSTISSRNSKTYAKVEGVTHAKRDIIFMSDCRMNNKVDDLKRMFGFNQNASYKVYHNSDRDSRGVAIAIKRHVWRFNVLDKQFGCHYSEKPYGMLKIFHTFVKQDCKNFIGIEQQQRFLVERFCFSCTVVCLAFCCVSIRILEARDLIGQYMSRISCSESTVKNVLRMLQLQIALI